QSSHAERLQDEGWFGPEGWTATGWFSGDKFRNGERAVIGTGRRWAEESWGKAYEMWQRRGQMGRIIYLNDRGEPDPVGEQALRDRALAYMERHGLSLGSSGGRDLPQSDPEYEDWAAMKFIGEFESARNMANFGHFSTRAHTEMQPELRDPKEEED